MCCVLCVLGNGYKLHLRPFGSILPHSQLLPVKIWRVLSTTDEDCVMQSQRGEGHGSIYVVSLLNT